MDSHPTAQAKYLLLDSRVVEHAENVELVLGHVTKDTGNPLFVEGKPWEVRYDNLYANVLYDASDQAFKVWYSPFIIDEVTSNTPLEMRKDGPYKPGKREMAICYAVSPNGISWKRPDLGIVEFNGDTHNNIVMRDIHGAGVWRDEQDTDPRRRYKAFAQGGVATSPDGLHWSAFQSCPEIEAEGDTHNNAFWFPEKGVYVGITRLWRDGQRIVGRTESPDFRKWTKAVEILRGTPEHQTYAMIAFPYCGVWLGLLMVYHTVADTVDCELAWSPDTVRWERICPGTPLIPRGSEGAFDSHCIYAAAYPLDYAGEIRLYYGGNNGPHSGWRNGGFGLARLRGDGFVGMTTIAESAGEVITKPVLCTGRRLCLSADASGGGLRVEVIGAEGLTLDSCQPITMDATDAAARWMNGANLAPLKGKPIRLRFHLESATLYSFSFAD